MDPPPDNMLTVDDVFVSMDLPSLYDISKTALSNSATHLAQVEQRVGIYLDVQIKFD